MHLAVPVCLAFFDFQHVKPWLESGGYGVLFLLLFACGLGLPLPEDIPLITSGILVAQRHMNIYIVAPVAWLGIMCGDTMLYCLGYSLGRGICKIPFIGKHVTVPRIQKAEMLFAKWGVWVVAIGRLFAGIRGAMVVAAGTTRFKYTKFIIADGLAAIFSGGMFIAMGYWFGSNLGKMWEIAHEFKLVLAGAAVVLIVAVIVYVQWRNRRHTTLGQVVVDKAQKVAVETTHGESSNK
jgi:membrane protein DedA with SNARE-associated domain